MKIKRFKALVAVVIILCIVICGIILNDDDKSERSSHEELVDSVDNTVEHIIDDRAKRSEPGHEAVKEGTTDKSGDHDNTDTLPVIRIDDNTGISIVVPSQSKYDDTNNTNPDNMGKYPADITIPNNEGSDSESETIPDDEKDDSTLIPEEPTPQPTAIPTEIPDNTLPDIPIP